MPYLKKAPKRPREAASDKTSSVYNSRRWQRLRQLYIADHPLCEFCFALGVLRPAEDVHHRDGFTNYTGAAAQARAYDWENLISLCKEHHAFLHRNGRTHGLNLAKEVDEWIKQQQNDKIK